MPSICIIIPIYNAEKYIHRCLNSVLNQTFRDFEVLLINDGSKDNSLEICREYSRKDRRFITIDKENGGAASARNVGLNWYYANSSCPWMCFLDIDDFVHEKYLEILWNATNESKLTISMCSYEVTHSEALTERLVDDLVQIINTEQLWCERQINCVIPWAKLFGRNAFSNVRFPEGIIHEDEFTLYKVLFQEREIAFVDLPLYGYFQTEQSVMRGKWTPRHMSEPEGILSQVKYFHENHFCAAESYSARMYLFSLYRNMTEANAVGPELKECVAKLKHNLRKGLLQYKKVAGISMKNESWLFFAAFPLLTAPYRVWKKIFG